MRRFASVFASRREKNGDSSAAQSSASSQSLSLTNRRNTQRVNTVDSPGLSSSSSSPAFGRRSDVGQSSASSSGSASLQTPDDTPISLDRAPSKSKSWISSWLGKKHSVTKVKHELVQPRESNREWHSPHPPPLLRPPPPGIRNTQTVNDSDSEPSDSDDDGSSCVSVDLQTHPTSPSFTIQISRSYLSARLQNDLLPRSSPSPFLLPSPKHDVTPIYPRSCNRPPLSPQDTLRSLMLKRHLLNRLQHSAGPLSPSEQSSILPLGMKTPPSSSAPSASSNDDVAPSQAAKIVHHPPGLRRWFGRPCFEHRFSVWLSSGGDIVEHMVTGTRFAVPDLEFSDALEAMVNFSEQSYLATDSSPPTPSSTDILSSPSSSATSPSLQLRSSLLSTPSPLRNETEAPEMSPSSLSSSQPSPPPVKRGVRFAEEDKEDQIPIGYIMRVKKQREAKAKFLREEKERRQFEIEKAKIEQERREREEQRRQWEMEKTAWEKERRAAEEERNRRLFAEEVSAARARQENTRSGGSNKALLDSGSVTSLRSNSGGERRPDSMQYSRSVYSPAAPSPRRQVSEPAPPVAYPGPANGSRPSSTHSSSSDDVRTKRMSVGSNYSSMHHGWGSNISLTSPSTGFIPPFAYQMPSPFLTSSSSFDMPLLPPTAPFMLHQYHRPRSNNSNSSSPSRNSINRSTDRVNRSSAYDSSSGRSSSSSPHRPGHQRHSSGDSHPINFSARGRSSEPASTRNGGQSASLRSSPNKPQIMQSHSNTFPSRRSTALS